MTSQPGSQTIGIYISINISRSKVNQTLTRGELIEYNMKNIFLGKSYTKGGVKSIRRPVSNKSKLSISLNQLSKDLYSLFLLYAKMMTIKIPHIKNVSSLTNLLIWNFEKTKKDLKLVSLPHFLHGFWRNLFLLLYSVTWQNFIVYLPLLRETLDSRCIAIVCEPSCDVINFEVNRVFLIKPFFYMTKKSRQKF